MFQRLLGARCDPRGDAWRIQRPVGARAYHPPVALAFEHDPEQHQLDADQLGPGPGPGTTARVGRLRGTLRGTTTAPALAPTPTCRQAGCPDPAGASGSGLCERHEAGQAALRASVLAPAKVGTGRVSPSFLGAGERPAWHERAACRGVGADAFYPAADVPRGAAGDPYADARKLCATCPVSGPCRLAGAHESYGLWAGQTPTERRSSST